MENKEMINTVEETVGTDLAENAVSATPKIDGKTILTGVGTAVTIYVVMDKVVVPGVKWAIRKIKSWKQDKQAKKAIPAESATDGIDPSEISDSELKIDD